MAVELITTADAYVVRVGVEAPEPLGTLAVAAALAVDLVRKQADGLGQGLVTSGAGGVTSGLIRSLLP